MFNRAFDQKSLVFVVVLLLPADREIAAFQFPQEKGILDVFLESALGGKTGRSIELTGKIQGSDFFAFGYRDAQQTHHSLEFQPIDSEVPLEDGERWHVYLRRNDRRQAIIDRILARPKEGEAAHKVRVKVARLAERQVLGGANLLELVDIQFPAAEGQGWGPWEIDAATKVERAAALKREAELAAQKEAERRAARTRVWRIGDSSIKAEFMSSTGGVASLRRADGKLIKIDLEDLSAEDRDWIRTRR